MKEGSSTIDRNHTNLNSYLKSINRVIAEALNVDETSRISVQTSKTLLNEAYLQYKDSLQNKDDLQNETLSQELYLMIKRYLEPYQNIIEIRKELEQVKNSKFSQIEKICRELSYGEIILKVQNGNPVLIESLKKQVKLI
ncbi:MULTISPECIES: DUF2292 domain-containing protein [Desulfitobacterium]|uniref:Uncharacterized protein n=1 Tax=Desulfitobacterium dehalogenans (strain ATCC 51507 / DSM 9161 / JW/IU-DC1) TaxID=756499 RepID=I4A7L8_DESDJ|nr:MULTISPECIES: DUF2292 domain-containing protein [Desulfitobacterium]AFL99952.1 hypothetical protein Desde_1544 [Desulfitobacterium dehalogenans ATCC 51507]